MNIYTNCVRSIRTHSAALIHKRQATPWGTRIPEVNQLIFHFVLDGPFWIQSKSSGLRKIGIGDLAIFPPHGTAHDTMHAPKSRLNTFEEELQSDEIPKPEHTFRNPTTIRISGCRALDGQLYAPTIGVLPPIVHVPAAQVSANPALMSILRLINSELHEPQPEGEKLIAPLLDLVFLYAIREWLGETVTNRAEWFAAQKSRSVEKALALIHAEPRSRWSLNDLSKKAGLSRAAFSRQFRDVLGVPPFTYLKSYRFHLAAQMLLSSDATIEEIAHRVGYDSSFAFSTAFKRAKGISPSEFRRMEQKNKIESRRV